MNMFLAIRPKMKVAITLFVLIASMCIGILMERHWQGRSREVNESIYADRLYPSYLLLHIQQEQSQRHFEANQIYIEDDPEPRDFDIYEFKIDSLILLFEKTLLTDSESLELLELKSDLLDYSSLLNSLPAIDNRSELDVLHFDIEARITALEEIQLTVGYGLNTESESLYFHSSILQNLILIILFIGLIIVQLLIQSSKSIRPRTWRNPDLN